MAACALAVLLGAAGDELAPPERLTEVAVIEGRATGVIIDGGLMLVHAGRKVIAYDAATGVRRWTYDSNDGVAGAEMSGMWRTDRWLVVVTEQASPESAEPDTLGTALVDLETGVKRWDDMSRVEAAGDSVLLFSSGSLGSPPELLDFRDADTLDLRWSM